MVLGVCIVVASLIVAANKSTERNAQKAIKQIEQVVEQYSVSTTVD
jgi:hypothetical protein